MSDVNGAALKIHAAAMVLPRQRYSRLTRIFIAGFVAMSLGIGGMLALPQIQRRLTSAQAGEYASVRHMHGHHMHEVGERMLRRDSGFEH